MLSQHVNHITYNVTSPLSHFPLNVVWGLKLQIRIRNFGLEMRNEDGGMIISGNAGYFNSKTNISSQPGVSSEVSSGVSSEVSSASYQRATKLVGTVVSVKWTDTWLNTRQQQLNHCNMKNK